MIILEKLNSLGNYRFISSTTVLKITFYESNACIILIIQDLFGKLYSVKPKLVFFV